MYGAEVGEGAGILTWDRGGTTMGASFNVPPPPARSLRRSLCALLRLREPSTATSAAGHPAAPSAGAAAVLRPRARARGDRRARAPRAAGGAAVEVRPLRGAAGRDGV